MLGSRDNFDAITTHTKTQAYRLSIATPSNTVPNERLGLNDERILESLHELLARSQTHNTQARTHRSVGDDDDGRNDVSHAKLSTTYDEEPHNRRTVVDVVDVRLDAGAERRKNRQVVNLRGTPREVFGVVWCV